MCIRDRAEAARAGTFSSVHAFEPVVFPATGQPPTSNGLLVAGALRRRAGFPSKQAAFDNYRSKPPMSSMRADILWDYVEEGFAPEDAQTEDGPVVLRCDPQVESATYEMAPRSTTWDRLVDVKCPVRVTCGGPTGHFQLDMSQAVAARVPDGTATELPHLSHFGPFEHPEDLAATIQ